MKHWLVDLTELKKLPIWLGLAAIIGLLYLGFARFVYGYSGFPLDDGWIHQTYARNLGQRGEFAFTPGVVSAGSTAPLWTILLSLGYAFRLPYQLWTYGLGLLLLGLTGFSLARLGQRLFPARLWLGPVIGLAAVFEWHLGWAAVSGMETILFIWLSIFILECYAALVESPKPGSFFWLGILGGLLALVRPEGLGLMGLIGLHTGLMALRSDADRISTGKTLAGHWLALGLGLAVPIIPYLAFNYAIAGHIFPNTLYAKQREYAILLQRFNFFQRWLRIVGVSFVGMQVLLVPGLIKAITEIWRRKDTFLALILIWWLSYVTLYAIRLPVIYQHGRYQIPMAPWILFFGLWGVSLLLKINHRQLWPRVLSRVWASSLALITVSFIFLGMQSYAGDVRIINTEMVAVAHWLNTETAPDTVIAVHDIGAIGYFTERPLVDLAGLITPDVIPFIRDETALLEFARSQGAEYLVTFPSWYPQMTKNLLEVYNTNSPWAIAAGSDNMVVYRLK